MREERVFLSEILISTEGKDAAGIAAAEKKAKDLVGASETRARNFQSWRKPIPTIPRRRMAARWIRIRKRKCGRRSRSAVWDKAERLRHRSDQRAGTLSSILKVDEHPKAGLAGFEEVQHEVQNKLYRAAFCSRRIART